MRTKVPRYGTPSIRALTLGRFEPKTFSTSNGTSTYAPPPPAFLIRAVKVCLFGIKDSFIHQFSNDHELALPLYTRSGQRFRYRTQRGYIVRRAHTKKLWPPARVTPGRGSVLPFL